MALITLTSSFGSGGEKVAQNVSEHLGIEFFDDHKLQQRSISMGISTQEIAGLEEKSPGFFDRLFTNKPAIYLDLLGAVVYDVASTGSGVIVGHGAQFFLQDFKCALHVMIHASEATRSKWLATEMNMDEAAATGLLRKMDKRFKDFVQYAFDRDWKDPAGYDLVINLDKVGAGMAANVIVEVAGADEIKECSFKALEEMEASSIKRRIDAAIIKNNLSAASIPVNIEVTGRGQVHLSGMIYDENDHQRLLSLVRGVSGVTEVRSDIIVTPRSGS